MGRSIPVTGIREKTEREGIETKNENDLIGCKAFLEVCDWSFLGFDFIILRHSVHRFWLASTGHCGIRATPVYWPPCLVDLTMPHIKTQHQNTRVGVLTKELWEQGPVWNNQKLVSNRTKACHSTVLYSPGLTCGVAKTPSLVEPPALHCNQPRPQLKSGLQMYPESRQPNSLFRFAYTEF